MMTYVIANFVCAAILAVTMYNTPTVDSENWLGFALFLLAGTGMNALFTGGGPNKFAAGVGGLLWWGAGNRATEHLYQHSNTFEMLGKILFASFVLYMTQAYLADKRCE